MKTIIVDVRTPAEFKLGSLKGALNIPSTEFTLDSYLAYKDHHISLLCSGGNRAQMVQEVLLEKGFEHVSTMLWHMDNLEFEKVQDSNWTVDRQFRLVLGVLLAIFLVGMSFEIRAILAIPIIICSGLLFSAITNNCFLKMGIAALPWNKKQGRTRQSENLFNNKVSSTAMG